MNYDDLNSWFSFQECPEWAVAVTRDAKTDAVYYWDTSPAVITQMGLNWESPEIHPSTLYSDVGIKFQRSKFVYAGPEDGDDWVLGSPKSSESPEGRNKVAEVLVDIFTDKKAIEDVNLEDMFKDKLVEDLSEQLMRGVGYGQVDNVNHPSHYTSHPSGVECIDITEHYDFCVGNAIKYLWRAGLKQDADKTELDKELEDLQKAKWYIDRKIKLLNKTKDNK